MRESPLHFDLTPREALVSLLDELLARSRVDRVWRFDGHRAAVGGVPTGGRIVAVTHDQFSVVGVKHEERPLEIAYRAGSASCALARLRELVEVLRATRGEAA